MPDGIDWTIKNINRKLSLAKLACRKKGKEIIDDILENDIPMLVEEIRRGYRKK
jgi:hypothetical protein